MKFSQMIFATTLTIAAATTFAAKNQPVTVSDQEDKVVVSTVATPETQPVEKPSSEQPASEPLVEAPATQVIQ